MKIIFQILVIASVAISIQSCNSKETKTQTAEAEKTCCSEKSENKVDSCCSEKKTETKSCCSSEAQVASGDVQAYYFHATRRCATCEAVEKVTAETLKAKYDGKVAFISINREEEKENPLLAKYKVQGQTLILVKGDEVVNLTNVAFINARSNPEKLQAKLEATVESMIN